MPIVIWHNPRCGTSRNVLAMIRATGVEPEIVHYLDTPPDAATLALVAAAVGGPRALLRDKEALATELRLQTADDARILASMGTHPVLINRPVVLVSGHIVLARPSERVLSVLPGSLPADFRKEDGSPVKAG